jgi:hypothetical protein
MGRNRNFNSGLGHTSTHVGVETVPKPRATGSKSGNIPSTRYWHQGFAVIEQEGIKVVPFLQRETAERISRQATRNTKIATRVVAIDDDDWGYTTEFEDGS